MVRYCGYCGQQLPDDSVFCTSCGKRLADLNAQESSQPGVPQGTPQPYPQWQAGNSQVWPAVASRLHTLRSAFFWMFVGSIVSVIPLVGVIGGVILLVGFILLVKGFGELSQAPLAGASYYRSTRDWILGAFLVAVSLAVVLGALVALLVPGVFGGKIVNDQARSALFPIAPADIAVIAGFGVAGLVVYLVAFVKLARSLKFLGRDLSVKSLASAGDYLVYSLIAYLAMYIALPLLFGLSFLQGIRFLTTNSTVSGTVTSVASTAIISVVAPFFGLFAAVASFSLVIWILQLLAYHSAYSGIDEYTRGETRPAP